MPVPALKSGTAFKGSVPASPEIERFSVDAKTARLNLNSHRGRHFYSGRAKGKDPRSGLRSDLGSKRTKGKRSGVRRPNTRTLRSVS